jgi:hypothetical protein
VPGGSGAGAPGTNRFVSSTIHMFVYVPLASREKMSTHSADVDASALARLLRAHSSTTWGSGGGGGSGEHTCARWQRIVVDK